MTLFSDSRFFSFSTSHDDAGLRWLCVVFLELFMYNYQNYFTFLP